MSYIGLAMVPRTATSPVGTSTVNSRPRRSPANSRGERAVRSSIASTNGARPRLGRRRPRRALADPRGATDPAMACQGSDMRERTPRPLWAVTFLYHAFGIHGYDVRTDSPRGAPPSPSRPAAVCDPGDRAGALHHSLLRGRSLADNLGGRPGRYLPIDPRVPRLGGVAAGVRVGGDPVGTASSTGADIIRRIQNTRRELLDLSARNRLIS